MVRALCPSCVGVTSGNCRVLECQGVLEISEAVLAEGQTDSDVECRGSALHGSLTSRSFHFLIRIILYDLQAFNNNGNNAPVDAVPAPEQNPWYQVEVVREVVR